MSTIRFNDAVVALIGAYGAAPALSGVPVYDSVVAMTGSDTDFIVIGHDGSLLSDGTLNPSPVAGTFTQSNLEMPGVRDEKGFVNCLVISQTGDAPDAAGRRQRASALLAAAEDAIAANGGYPASAPGLLFDGTSDGRFVNRLTSSGIAVLLAYRVAYSTGWA